MSDDRSFDDWLTQAYARYVSPAPVDVDPHTVVLALTRASSPRLATPRMRPLRLLAIAAALVAAGALIGSLAAGGWLSERPRPTTGQPAVAPAVPTARPAAAAVPSAPTCRHSAIFSPDGPPVAAAPPALDFTVAIVSAARDAVDTWGPDGTVRRIVQIDDTAMPIVGPVMWGPGLDDLAFNVAGPDGQPACSGLFTVRHDGTGLRDLSPAVGAGEGVGAASWSPTGFALLGHRWSRDAGIERTQQVIIEPDGRSRDLAAPSDCRPFGGGQWSPDGERIAFPSVGPDAVVCIFRRDATLAPTVRLHGVPSPEHWQHDSLRWSWDGKDLLLFGDAADGVWLYRVRVADGKATRIEVDDSLRSAAPDISDDESTVRFIALGPGPGTWLWTVDDPEPTRITTSRDAVWVERGFLAWSDDQGLWAASADDLGHATKIVGHLPAAGTWSLDHVRGRLQEMIRHRDRGQ